MASKDSPPRGILIDLDFATQVRDGDRILSPEPTFTGTLPFLSIDLLTASGPAPQRLYRHDLESFFYILGWMLARYDAHGRRKPLHQFTTWYKGPLDDIISAKRKFMGVPSRVPSDRSLPSLQTWLRNLCRIVDSGYKEKDREPQNPHFDSETFITFDTFMGATPQITL
ncbi:uncharacterized protein EI90DRAFT_3043843 [Cantharellus anzutake]|uniref:uncharacterized protein n=1 Tax=Cantharellus anzutake TaxID=1750568 RepID=UPI0019051DAB|nr:uncharacterized protein EI90DRAFT_3043843 [Cantharellus anzutake]KAF8336849.1 hypothetical protein EI90DRAFT_3043843 [Cantharellus anzutake]